MAASALGTKFRCVWEMFRTSQGCKSSAGAASATPGGSRDDTTDSVDRRRDIGACGRRRNQPVQVARLRPELAKLIDGIMLQ
ncbi:hypothetical protein CCR94_20290 [Rhodoblastus sphagnicola]|uniref:Uncharacterized protein n=1 Tax=Rhodoblastus sphagnicola TaxID=333368 RepID=A0A2S6MXU3_9HYPH|nr:hypothetical protein CCR94_20290 [Rhodoblastus sphagnicola]